jgi:hypothetical protein
LVYASSTDVLTNEAVARPTSVGCSYGFTVASGYARQLDPRTAAFYKPGKAPKYGAVIVNN